ncbi:MAG: MFS transporter [Acidimicrobiales bacterium]
MSLLPGAAAYGRLLRLPTARRAVAASSICRLSYGTLVLAKLLVVEQATHSFAVAGAASGVFSVCTLSGPAKARFLGDEHGGGRVAILSVAYLGSLAGLALLAGTAHAPAPFLALSATAGLSVPPVGAMMRARWASITPEADRQRAFALDVALEDSLFLVGPLLSGGLIALDGPGLAMWVTAALFAAGINLLGRAPQATVASPADHARRTTPRASVDLWQPLRSSEIRAALVVLLGISAGVGVIDVAVAARAVQSAETAAAGYVLAAAALGSVAGGLIWGNLPHRHGPAWQLAGLGGLVAATLAAGAAAPSLAWLAAVLTLNGAALSPLLIVVYLVVDCAAGGVNRTLVSTWANTTFNAGAAAGAAAGGALVAWSGPTLALNVGACLAATAATAAMLAIGTRHTAWRRPASRSSSTGSTQTRKRRSWPPRNRHAARTRSSSSTRSTLTRWPTTSRPGSSRRPGRQPRNGWGGGQGDVGAQPAGDVEVGAVAAVRDARRAAAVDHPHLSR